MLSKFSVKKPYTILVAVLLVVILGAVSFTKMTPDLMPSMDLPYAIVMTTYEGASPETVEMTVTKPVEQAMATINNIENVSSVSQENMSMVVLEFNADANMDTAIIDMREALDLITGFFPDSIGKPMIMKLNPDMMPVLVAAIDAEGIELEDLSTMVENEIVPSIESVEGVGRVNTSGMLKESINVILNQDKIDRVNKKIEKAMKRSFKDAEQELKKAENKMNSGKSELDEQSSKLYDTLAKADQALLNGKLDIAGKKAQLTQSLATLEGQMKQLLKAEKELKDQKTKLTVLKKQMKDLKTQRDSLTEAKENLEKQIKDIEKNPVLTEEQKKQQITLLKTSLGTLKQQLETFDAALKEQGVEDLDQTVKDLEKTEKEMNDGIDQISLQRSQAEDGKKQIEDGLKAINKGEKQLDTQMIGMEAQKGSAQQKLGGASAQIIAGESGMKSSEKQLQEAKDKAVEQASLEGKITPDMIKGILTAQNFSMPAGYITDDHTDYLVRVGDKIEHTDQVDDLILMDLGLDGLKPIRLKDVADVAVTDNSKDIYTKVNGNNGVVLTVEKQNNYATADVSDRVQDKFNELTDEIDGLHITNLMDQGVYIHLIIDSVLHNIWMGAILAILILFLFLKNGRATFMVGISIPISVLLAIVMMYFSGVSLNMISLSGLALGVGMLVDNAIVVMENIFRLRKEGVSAKSAAIEGASQVFGAICASTLTTISVFLPIAFVEGITKTWMQDMAFTIGFSLLASLIAAVTVIPAMSKGLLENFKDKKDYLLPKIKEWYGGFMEHILRHSGLVVAGALLLMILTGAMAFSKGSSLMPSMESQQMSASLTMPQGTELEETKEMSDEIVDRIRTVKGVKMVGATAGSGAMMGMGGSEQRNVSMYILLDENNKRSNAEIQKEIEDKTKDLDCEFIVQASAMDMSAMGEAGIAIQIKGKDLDRLSEIADDIAGIVEKTEGTKEVSNGQEDTTKEIRISVDKSKAMAYGLTVAQVYQSINGMLSKGSTATVLDTGDTEYDINVRDGAGDTLTPEELEKVHIKGTKDGKEKNVRLNKIAEFNRATGPNAITRDSQSRYMKVTATLKDSYNIGLVSEEIQKKLDQYELPKGYSIKMGGEFEMIEENVSQVLLMLVLAIAFMYLIMVAQFQSLKSPFIILFTIPLAFTGGFIALMMCGMDVSIISMFGFIMLSGIIVNNGIVLIDYINHLRSEGMNEKDAIIEAGQTRLRPIVMTALTTILGLMFMAAGVGDGSEMMQPMAVVVIGGLIYGTILTLIVIPCVYDKMNRIRKSFRHRKNRKSETDL